MNSYCERQGKALNSVRFLFDGRRVEAHHTPEELEMEEGDMIEATVEQQGTFVDRWGRIGRERRRFSCQYQGCI